MIIGILKNYRFIILSLLAVMYCIPLIAQVDERVSSQNAYAYNEDIIIHFPFNSSIIDSTYKQNYNSLEALNKKIINASIDLIIVYASSSPDGISEYNKKLASERGTAIKSYILHKNPNIEPHRIITHAIGENWSTLYNKVYNDPEVPQRKRVLAAIESEINGGTKKWRIRQINNGKAWSYIQKRFFADLRNANIVRISNQASDNKTVEPNNKKHGKELIELIDLVCNQDSIDTTVTDNSFAEMSEIGTVETHSLIKSDYRLKPIFAIKTNLLYDLASALNIELEVPIGKRLSFSGEWIFPWWLLDTKNEQFCLQIMQGTLEARYWWGDRDKRSPLTGWFTGVHAGLGLFDIQWRSKGYQGDWLISSGLSLGYAHNISSKGNLRMEYSLGAGYIRTHYDEYLPQKGADNKWHLIRQKEGTFSFIGPTRAKISLVWMINRKIK